jgi:hypothetical protein
MVERSLSLERDGDRCTCWDGGQAAGFVRGEEEEVGIIVGGGEDP